MTEHTPTPWIYRSSPHDDWGWIRGPKTEDGIAPLVAMARSGVWENVEMLDEHRAAKTDPYGANALFIIKAVNNHDALVSFAKYVLEMDRDSNAPLFAKARAVLANVGREKQP